jgi:putative DNA primase/helicase
MNSPLDFSTINSNAMARLPDLLFRWFPAGKMDGYEFKVGNLTGIPGKSLSINIRTGQWADFASDGKGGDLISLYAAIHRIQQGEAARAIAEDMGTISPTSPSRTQSRKKKPKWTPLTPIPDDAPVPDFRHPSHGSPSKVFTYHNEKKQILGYVCRFDKPGTKKEIVPFSYCRSDTGSLAWRWKALDAPRPLYGLDELAGKPNATVIIVEGEKAADAGRQLLPNMVVITWSNGSKAIHRVDWEALKGREKVVLVPDADEPGRAAMDGTTDDYGVWKPGIAQLIEKIVDKIHVIHMPDEFPEGWDLADALQENWTQEQTIEFLRGSAHPPTSKPVENRASELPTPDEEPFQKNFESSSTDSSPFRVLGYNKGSFYFLTTRGQQVLELTGRSLRDKGSLFQLASLQYWEMNYPSKRGFSGQAVDQAANALVQTCYKVGVYNPDRLRGRGAWWDEQRVVLHCGDRLVVDGQETGIPDLPSQYIYEASPHIRPPALKPLADEKALWIFDIASRFVWEKPLSAILLAGFVALARSSGALQWRPHIWITGPRGCGKSEVLRRYVQILCGDWMLDIDGDASSAFVRQKLVTDAFPVIYDESEAQTKMGLARLQQILSLVRSSSREGGGAIGRGSANGKAIEYRIRSCFAIASIYVNLKEAADFSRTSVLSMAEPKGQTRDEWKILSNDLNQLKAPDISDGLFARTLQLLPVIRENQRIFSSALHRLRLGDQRFGDQIGTLLAGAYSLKSHNRIAPHAAEAWIKSQDWSDQLANSDERDEISCLTHLLQWPLVAETSNDKRVTRTIEELVGIAAERTVDDALSAKKAMETLRRNGLRVDNNVMSVAHKHLGLSRIFQETPFAIDHTRILKRLPFSWTDSKRKVRFLPLDDKPDNKDSFKRAAVHMSIDDVIDTG